MDARADYYARSDSASFGLAEKLAYYNEADGILNGLIIRQQEDRNETEQSYTTVAGQSDYAQPSGIHHVNWLKVSYDGTSYLPARYVPEAELIALYGTELGSTLAGWSGADPIYFFKGSHLFVYPAPTAAQAGAARLRGSFELLPSALDRSANETPTMVPANFHHLHPAYAAMKWLDEDDPLWRKAKRAWDEGVALMLETLYPRARESELVAGFPAEEGWDY